MNLLFIGTEQNVIAFRAHLTEDQTVSPGDNFIFNEAILNYGNAYNADTGIFQCPVHGLYMMLSTILTNDNIFYTGQLRLDDPDGTQT